MVVRREEVSLLSAMHTVRVFHHTSCSDPANNSKVKGGPNFKNEPVKQEHFKKKPEHFKNEPVKQEHFKKKQEHFKNEPVKQDIFKKEHMVKQEYFKSEPMKRENFNRDPMKREQYKKEPMQVKKEPSMKKEESEDGGAVRSTMGMHDGEHVVGGRIGMVR